MQGILEAYNWLQTNGAVLVAIIMGALSVAEMIVRLTPTQKDDGAVERVGKFIRNAFDFMKVPNKKVEGGEHPPVKETL